MVPLPQGKRRYFPWGRVRCYPVFLVALYDLTTRDEGKEAIEADVPSLLSPSIHVHFEYFSSTSNCCSSRSSPMASLCQVRSGLSSCGFQSSPRVTTSWVLFTHPFPDASHCGPTQVLQTPTLPTQLCKMLPLNCAIPSHLPTLSSATC